MQTSILIQLCSVVPTLNPVLYKQSSPNNSLLPDEAACADLAARLQQALFSELGQLNSQDQLSLQVSLVQSFCTSLLDDLYAYREALPLVHLKPTVSKSLIHCSHLIEEAAISLLCRLQQYFQDHFKRHSALPKVYFQSEKSLLISRIKEIKENWIEFDLQELNMIAFGVATRCLDTPGNTPCTWHELQWLRKFLDRLEQVDLLAEQETPALLEILIELGCNDPVFVQYILRRLQSSIDAECSVQEQTHEWLVHLAYYQCQPASQVDQLFTNLAPIGKAMSKVIGQELKRLCKYSQRDICVDNPGKAGEAVFFKTPLSVSQLAVFTRLLVEAELLEQPNLSGLFKSICGRVASKKAASLSPQSLRAKYYQCDTAAVKIVKEYLLRMMSVLNRVA